MLRKRNVKILGQYNEEKRLGEFNSHKNIQEKQGKQ